MSVYREKLISLEGHRLQLFDAGYGFAASINLICERPLDRNYQQRSVAERVINYIKRHQSESIAVYWCSDQFTEFPLVAAYHLNNNDNVHYYLGHRVKGYAKNNLVRDLASKIINYSTDNDNKLLEMFLKDKALRKLMVFHYQGLKTITTFLQSKDKWVKERVFQAFIFDYSMEKNYSDYFNLRELGLVIHENADFSGGLDFY